MKISLYLFLMVIVAGCGGGGSDDGGGNDPSNPSSTPSNPSDPSDPSSTPSEPSDPSDPSSTPSEPSDPSDPSSTPTNPISSFYDTLPDISTCYEGVLKDAEKQKALNILNDIRTLHKLKPVTYNYSDDVYTAKSALISVANAKLDHHPTVDYKCWSSEGETGSSKSNLQLYLATDSSSLHASDDAIVSFLVDNNVESLGHRRWVINPFLSFVSYGRVDGKPLVNSQWDFVTGASLKVINDEDAYIEDLLIDFVAYPYEEYPNRYFKHGWYMSFSALIDKSSSWNNQNVDYSNAKVEVSKENGGKLNVHSISYNNQGFGLPNVLQWKVDNTTNDTKYLVKITNVSISNSNKDFEYWFKIN